MVAVIAKQQYRAEHLWRLRLDHQHEVRKDIAQRRASGNHLVDAFLLRAKIVRHPPGASGRWQAVPESLQ